MARKNSLTNITADDECIELRQGDQGIFYGQLPDKGLYPMATASYAVGTVTRTYWLDGVNYAVVRTLQGKLETLAVKEI